MSEPKPTHKTSCPKCNDEHPDMPSGFVAAMKWAETMQKTHEQQRCPECGKFTIWTPKAPLYRCPQCAEYRQEHEISFCNICGEEICMTCKFTSDVCAVCEEWQDELVADKGEDVL